MRNPSSSNLVALTMENRHSSITLFFDCREFSSGFDVFVGDSTREILTATMLGRRIEVLTSLHTLAGVEESSSNYTGKISNPEPSHPEVSLGVVNLFNICQKSCFAARSAYSLKLLAFKLDLIHHDLLASLTEIAKRTPFNDTRHSAVRHYGLRKMCG
jgi:hypothetical protein